MRFPTLFALLGATLIVAIVAIDTSESSADERLKGRACRSVHLGYKGSDGSIGEGTVFYNEVTVEKSANGTYFAVCGFNRGYFGIQQLGNGKRLVIFSVWDPGKQNNPNVVPEERRVKLLHQGEGVRVGRFGNEGTGGQSFYDYPWKVGETYRFLVRSEIQGERTAYAGYFRGPESKSWKHLITFSTLPGKTKNLRGYYAFVEDFKRNRVSATQERRARFGNGWVRELDGNWTPLTQAKFTGDANPVMNIDAGISGTDFFLATGGDIENTHTPLWKTMKRDPIELPGATPAKRAPVEPDDSSTAESEKN